MRKSFELDMFIARSILKLWSNHTSTGQRYLLGSRLPSVKLDWLRGSSVALLGALLRNQRGTGKSKNTPVTNFTTIPKSLGPRQWKSWGWKMGSCWQWIQQSRQGGWLLADSLSLAVFGQLEKEEDFFWGHPHIHTWKYFWIFIYVNIVLSLLSEHLAICRVHV